MTSTDPESPDNDPEQPVADPTRRAGGTSWIRTAVIATVAVGGLVTLALTGETDPASSGEAAQDDSGILALPFLTVDGDTSTLADYGGQPLVVNFFASWCPPCRAELPDFEAVHQKIGGQVTFVGINQDFTEETWRAFVAESQISYDTVFQPDSQIWTEIGTQAMPTTVFISPSGEIEEIWAGLITDDKLEELIGEALLEPAS